MQLAFEENIVKRLLSGTEKKEKIVGILLFGSRATDFFQNISDFDIGIIYQDHYTPKNLPENWDVFTWKKERWMKGFPLQLELARKSRILYDPRCIVEQRLEFLRRNLLPDWEHYLVYKPHFGRTFR